MANTITSPVYVVQDNIDTDQIIPAQYLTLVPTIQEEYEKLGSYALIGLPDSLYPTRFVAEGETKTTMVGRFGPRSHVRSGDVIDVAVETNAVHLFDLDTSEGIYE